MFDGGCHVATTLSVTSLAKYVRPFLSSRVSLESGPDAMGFRGPGQMFRGVANAGLFFLAAAKAKKERRLSAAVSREHERTTPASARTGALGAGTDAASASASTTSAVNPAAPVEPVLQHEDHAAANATTHEDVEREDESDESDANTESSASSVSADEEGPQVENVPPQRITATGHLPAFSSASSGGPRAAHMIRQRVNLHGFIRPLEPPDELDGCTMNPEHIGLLHAGPVRKWLAQRSKWDDLFAKDLAYWRDVKTRDRVRAREGGFLLGQFAGENPPAGSVAGWHDAEMAKKAASSVDEAVGKKTSATLALAAWSNISNKPDEDVAGDKKVEQVRAEVGEEQAKEAEQNPAA